MKLEGISVNIKLDTSGLAMALKKLSKCLINNNFLNYQSLCLDQDNINNKIKALRIKREECNFKWKQNVITVKKNLILYYKA